MATTSSPSLSTAAFDGVGLGSGAECVTPPTGRRARFGRWSVILMSDSSEGATQHVGPIIFGHPVARAQLVEEGEVVSFRTSDRTTGETWWRKTRTGPKEGDVTVECLGPAEHPAHIAGYVDRSGFDSVEEWLMAIGDVHDTDSISGYLYRVTEGHND